MPFEDDEELSAEGGALPSAQTPTEPALTASQDAAASVPAAQPAAQPDVSESIAGMLGSNRHALLRDPKFLDGAAEIALKHHQPGFIKFLEQGHAAAQENYFEGLQALQNDDPEGAMRAFNTSGRMRIKEAPVKMEDGRWKATLENGMERIVDPVKAMRSLLSPKEFFEQQNADAKAKREGKESEAKIAAQNASTEFRKASTDFIKEQKSQLTQARIDQIRAKTQGGGKPAISASDRATMDKMIKAAITETDEFGKKTERTDEYAPRRDIAARVLLANPDMGAEAAAGVAADIPFISRDRAMRQAQAEADMIEKNGTGLFTDFEDLKETGGKKKEVWVNERAAALVADTQAKRQQLLSEYGVQVGGRSGKRPPTARDAAVIRTQLPNLSPQERAEADAQSQSRFGMPLDKLLEQFPEGGPPMGERPIDKSRPKIDNGDGTFSTERTITIEADGKQFLIPTIVGGKHLSNDEAIRLWRSGKNKEVGVFNTPEEAEQAAQARSQRIFRERGNEPRGALPESRATVDDLGALNPRNPAHQRQYKALARDVLGPSAPATLDEYVKQRDAKQRAEEAGEPALAATARTAGRSLQQAQRELREVMQSRDANRAERIRALNEEIKQLRNAAQR